MGRRYIYRPPLFCCFKASFYAGSGALKSGQDIVLFSGFSADSPQGSALCLLRLSEGFFASCPAPFVFEHINHCWLYFAVRSANILALRNLSFFASAFVVDFLHWELLSSYLISPIASPIASPIGASGVFPGQVGGQMGKQLGTAISWNPWFSYIFGSSWFSPKICSPDFTIWSDNLFDRDFFEKWQVLWTSFSGPAFRSVPSDPSLSIIL